MSDRFYETDVDFEAVEYDDDMTSLMNGVESLDDEFFNPLDLITGGIGAIGNLLGGRGRAPAPGVRAPQPNIQKYPNRLPTPAPGVPNPMLNHFPVTQAQFQGLQKQVTAIQAGQQTINKRAEVINNRVNTVEKKLSTEVTRINAANVAQGQLIQRQARSIKGVREDLEKSTQTSLMLTLLSGGKKDYEVAAPAAGTPVTGGSKVSLKPSGGSLDMLLPLFLFSGTGSGGKGGLFDNPLILILLLDSLGNK